MLINHYTRHETPQLNSKSKNTELEGTCLQLSSTLLKLKHYDNTDFIKVTQIMNVCSIKTKTNKLDIFMVWLTR